MFLLRESGDFFQSAISLNAFFSPAYILSFFLNVRSTHWERRCVDVDVDVDVAGGALPFKYKPKRRSGRLPVGASRRSWDRLARQKPATGPGISARSTVRFVCVKSTRLFQTQIGTVWHHPRRYHATNFTGVHKRYSGECRITEPYPTACKCISFISDYRI